MAKRKLNKKNVEKIINYFFSNTKDKTSKDIKKIKRLAMKYNIKLKDKRKKFCKYCLNPYSGKERIRIKKKMKIIICEKCGKVNRWEIS
ncbi:MAG: hypothetical protein QW117_01370 [Candidatus Pacearchaeota archaeon]